MKIEEFVGEYFFLSNFYPCKIHYSDYVFPSVENAYRAASCGVLYFDEFIDISPYEANRLGRLLGESKDFNIVKYTTMEKLVREKFSNMELKKMLFSTKGMKLQNLSRFKDHYWGVGMNGVGLNKLGDILSEIRDEL